MKILVLEDEDNKFKEISDFILETIDEVTIQRETNWLSYTLAVSKTKYDLILLDLLVPKSNRDSTIENHHHSLVSSTRDYESKSFFTPAIVLTRQSLEGADFVYDLNKVDINVITFNDHGEWRDALKIKLLACEPKKSFDFIIVCALEKEADAFETYTDTWGEVKTISGLMCREIQIGGYKGAIVRAHRMGLVAAAVVATMALERFSPRLICMSGICGGVVGESKIYDLLVTQVCHQHDAGKWSTEGFKSEHYDIQLDVDVQNGLLEVCSNPGLKSYLLDKLNPRHSEFPEGEEQINCNIVSSAVTSSGSAVVAEDGKSSTLSVGQRKLSGFDMEIYSIYEAARYARNKPAYFAAKAVVDDGGKNKGDKFHRIGCLLSAKFIVTAIRAGIVNEGAS
ncbi:MAG: response regulator [Pseudohongiella sp.]|nr:response regulator [Pseudohongiella sp.]